MHVDMSELLNEAATLTQSTELDIYEALGQVIGMQLFEIDSAVHKCFEGDIARNDIMKRVRRGINEVVAQWEYK